MNISVRIIIILVCFKVCVSLSNDNYIRLLVDLIESFDNPSSVASRLCWNMRDKTLLTKRLGRSERPHTIKFINRPIELSKIDAKNCIVIADLSCPGVDVFLVEANNTNMFQYPYRWLIIDRQKTAGGDHDATIHPQLEDTYVPLNSDFIIAQEKIPGDFDVLMIYKLQARRIWLAENFGKWTSSSGLTKNIMISDTVSRRRNLHQEPLIVNFVVDEIHTGFRSNECDYMIQGALQTVTKWGYRQILPLFDYVNASRRNFFSNGWGYLINGSWTGLIGDMTWGPADLCGTVMFMTDNRLPYVTYLTNSIHTSIKFVFREPPLSYQNNLFLLPFQATVWYSIAGFLLLMMAVIYTNALWERKKNYILDEGDQNNENDVNLTMSDVALIITGAVTQQGTTLQLRGPIGRLLTFMLLLAFLLIYTAYAASIIVLLQSSSKQIRTLSDLLNSRLELGVENTSYNKHYFLTETDPVRKAIYEKKVATQGHKPNFMPLEEGVKRLQKHPFAFNMNTGDGYTFVERFFFEHEKCGLQEVEYFPTQKLWLTCRKNSPYAELYKIGYARIREHGISDRANSLEYSKKPVCTVSGGKFDSVSIVDVSPPLVMLLYGTALATALLGLELMMHRIRSGAVGSVTSDFLDDSTF